MTFPDLCLRIARAVKDDPALDRVPLPVIASAVEAGLRHFAAYCPASLGDFAEVEALDLEPCETCGNLIDPGRPDGAVSDPDAGWFCEACKVEMTPDPGDDEARASHGS